MTRRLLLACCLVAAGACDTSTEPDTDSVGYSGLAYAADTNDGIAGVRITLARDTLLGAVAEGGGLEADRTGSDGRWTAIVSFPSGVCDAFPDGEVVLELADPSGTYRDAELTVPFCADGRPRGLVPNLGARMVRRTM